MNKKALLTAGIVAALAFLLLAPHFIYPVLLMRMLCFAMFACAFNLLLGYTGLLSFGHAAYFGMAAYVTGHALKEWGVPVELGLLMGAVAAGILGWIVGGLAIRRQGIYFSMITLAMAQMVYFIFLQAPFTGGEDGLQGIPRGKLLGIVDLATDINLYYFIAGIFVAAFCLIYRIIHSPFGQILKAIRENEPRAISLGYDVPKYKLVAFVLSSALAGLAGATKVLVFNAATLTDAHWHQSGEVVLMTILGGIGTVLGPIVGASVIVALQNELADKVGSWVIVIMGAIFVVCVLLFRRGIVGEVSALYKRMVGARA